MLCLRINDLKKDQFITYTVYFQHCAQYAQTHHGHWLTAVVCCSRCASKTRLGCSYCRLRLVPASCRIRCSLCRTTCDGSWSRPSRITKKFRAAGGYIHYRISLGSCFPDCPRPANCNCTTTVIHWCFICPYVHYMSNLYNYIYAWWFQNSLLSVLFRPAQQSLKNITQCSSKVFLVQTAIIDQTVTRVLYSWDVCADRRGHRLQQLGTSPNSALNPLQQGVYVFEFFDLFVRH